MSKPNLIYMFDSVDSETGTELLLEIDKNTNELYVNKRRVVTDIDIKLRTREQVIAWIVASATVAIAICDVFSIYLRCRV